ncbi:hypothetical protein [Bacillus atrophaeus]|nr:hypothetical protein [Bacillus atrophaeus]MEC0804749.1 hypothetical protein [Bacillus atrophaeus]MEC0852666.1 hypothetical protein [Bacillus atrophaeus]MEC0859578.1 hypothetical protein [Bacillus atrophaeus]MEC0862385.1 hypothetical protein [Bacillus atrophaeus]MEC0868661.1 hypothetical protein [Bacillus atrophaeus]
MKKLILCAAITAAVLSGLAVGRKTIRHITLKPNEGFLLSEK